MYLVMESRRQVDKFEIEEFEESEESKVLSWSPLLWEYCRDRIDKVGNVLLSRSRSSCLPALPRNKPL